MLLKQIFETPIEDMTFHGNWEKNSSFGAQDRKLLNNPKAQEKIKRQWLNTTVPVNIFFVNSPEANKHTEVGEVSRNWLYQNLPIFYEDMAKSGKIIFNPNAINVIYTNNKGGKRVPMTGWVIAHRLGHVLYRKYGINGLNYNFESFTKTFNDYMAGILNMYNVPYTHVLHTKSTLNLRFGDSEIIITLMRFFETIGTMKSAREKKLNNFFEFYMELIAQYLITGSVKFNPAPPSFQGYKKRFYSCPDNDLEYVNSDLETLAENCNDSIAALLGSSVGKVYVM